MGWARHCESVPLRPRRCSHAFERDDHVHAHCCLSQRAEGLVLRRPVPRLQRHRARRAAVRCTRRWNSRPRGGCDGPNGAVNRVRRIEPPPCIEAFCASPGNDAVLPTLSPMMRAPVGALRHRARGPRAAQFVAPRVTPRT